MNNRVREILGALLAFDTTSRESNLALIALPNATGATTVAAARI